MGGSAAFRKTNNESLIDQIVELKKGGEIDFTSAPKEFTTIDRQRNFPQRLLLMLALVGLPIYYYYYLVVDY